MKTNTTLHLILALLVGASFMSACGDDEEEEPMSEITCSGTAGSTETLSCGTLLVTPNGPNVVKVDVPDGAESFALVFDAGSNLTVASKITSPSGTVVFDFDADVNTNLQRPTDGLYTMLVPNNPEVAMESGTWTVEWYGGDADYNAPVTAAIKGAPSSANALNLNLFFVGTGDITAESAPNDTDFQAMLSNVETVFQTAGISLGDKNYIEITGADAEKLSQVELADGELAELFAHAAGQTNNAMNLFFVADLTDANSSATQLGQAGGVPGPPGIHGTGNSGMVINMANVLAAKDAGDAAMLAEATAQVEIITAHETGHYLGLYHTSEKDGGSHDHLSDTAECLKEADTSGNGTISASECAGSGGENLMFWSPKNESRTLSANQGAVLATSVTVK